MHTYVRVRRPLAPCAVKREAGEVVISQRTRWHFVAEVEKKGESSVFFRGGVMSENRMKWYRSTCSAQPYHFSLFSYKTSLSSSSHFPSTLSMVPSETNYTWTVFTRWFMFLCFNIFSPVALFLSPSSLFSLSFLLSPFLSSLHLASVFTASPHHGLKTRRSSWL